MPGTRRRRITKRPTPGLEEMPKPVLLPGHTRQEEWNGFKHLQPVLVSPITRKGSHYIFLYHVTDPEGREYVEVLEQKVYRSRQAGGDRNGPRLIRSLEPDRIYQLPKKIRRRLEAKESA